MEVLLGDTSSDDGGDSQPPSNSKRTRENGNTLLYAQFTLDGVGTLTSTGMCERRTGFHWSVSWSLRTLQVPIRMTMTFNFLNSMRFTNSNTGSGNQRYCNVYVEFSFKFNRLYLVSILQ